MTGFLSDPDKIGKIRRLFHWRCRRSAQAEKGARRLPKQTDNSEKTVSLVSTECNQGSPERSSGVLLDEGVHQLADLVDICHMSSTQTPSEGASISAASTSVLNGRNAQEWQVSCLLDDGFSDTSSVLSGGSQSTSCSTACSINDYVHPAAYANTQTLTRQGYPVTAYDTRFPRTFVQGHRQFTFDSDFNHLQFAADRFNSGVEVEEGWTGMVVWRRRQTRAAERRSPAVRTFPVQRPGQGRTPRLGLAHGIISL